jgi:hypothetical protein
MRASHAARPADRSTLPRPPPAAGESIFARQRPRRGPLRSRTRRGGWNGRGGRWCCAALHPAARLPARTAHWAAAGAGRPHERQTRSAQRAADVRETGQVRGTARRGASLVAACADGGSVPAAAPELECPACRHRRPRRLAARCEGGQAQLLCSKAALEASLLVLLPRLMLRSRRPRAWVQCGSSPQACSASRPTRLPRAAAPRAPSPLAAAARRRRSSLSLVQLRLALDPHHLYHSLASAGSVSRAAPSTDSLQRPLRRPVAELPARPARAAHFTLLRRCSGSICLVSSAPVVCCRAPSSPLAPPLRVRLVRRLPHRSCGGPAFKLPPSCAHPRALRSAAARP